jgi:hypothetical protein
MVSKRVECHEQDGETLQFAKRRIATASGDPAMAIGPFVIRRLRPEWARRLVPSGVTAAAYTDRSTTRGKKRRVRTLLKQRILRSRTLRRRKTALTANAELVDQRLIARLIGALEIIEQLATLRHELQ